MKDLQGCDRSLNSTRQERENIIAWRCQFSFGGEVSSHLCGRLSITFSQDVLHGVVTGVFFDGICTIEPRVVALESSLSLM